MDRVPFDPTAPDTGRALPRDAPRGERHGASVGESFGSSRIGLDLGLFPASSSWQGLTEDRARLQGLASLEQEARVVSAQSRERGLPVGRARAVGG